MRLFLFLVIFFHNGVALETAMGERRIEANMTPVAVVGTIASLLTLAIAVALVTSCRNVKHVPDNKKDTQTQADDASTPLSSAELTAIPKSGPATA